MTDQLLKQGLHTWPKPVKLFLVGFIFLLTNGVTIGMFFLFTTTSFTAVGTVEHYNGSSVSADDPLAIQEKYPKPLSEILLTTHNHFIGFSFIFFILGGLFYFNSTIHLVNVCLNLGYKIYRSQNRICCGPGSTTNLFLVLSLSSYPAV